MVLSWLFPALGGTCLAREPAAQDMPKRGPVRLPLYHTKGAPNEGVFKARFGIGGKEFDVIIDTCSTDVILVGEQCGKTCQHTAGNYPKHADTYTGRVTHVSYVSQTNVLSWARDKVKFITELKDRPQIGKVDVPPLSGTETKENNMEHPLHFGTIISNVSHNVQGGSMPGRSIVGLMAPQTRSDAGLGLLNENDTTSFINQMFGAKGVFAKNVYSIAIEPSGDIGEIIFGGLHKGIQGWVPLVPASELPMLKHVGQWVIRLQEVHVIGYDGPDAYKILATLPLKLARFDTGNTWLSMPQSVFKKHGHLGEMPGVAGIQVVLENNLTLWLPATSFSGSVAMANATGYGGLAQDNSIPSNMCIFGNEIMKGMTVACDLDKAELGFGGMCAKISTPDTPMGCDQYVPPEMETH